MSDATLKAVREFFGMTMGEFKEGWMPLSGDVKAELKAGIGDGSIGAVGAYFGDLSITDWTGLSDTDKAQLKAGIGDGTLTY